MNDQLKSIIANGIVIILVSLLMFFAGTWWRMSSQFNLGEAAFNKGDFVGAVAGYESALHMYIPFHPTIEKAAERLVTANLRFVMTKHRVVCRVRTIGGRVVCSSCMSAEVAPNWSQGLDTGCGPHATSCRGRAVAPKPGPGRSESTATVDRLRPVALQKRLWALRPPGHNAHNHRYVM